MTSHLYFDVLDDEAFPELKVEVGRKGINARVLQPPGDPRVPASLKSPTLLVAFRLDEPAPRTDLNQPLPKWQLNFTDLVGKPQQVDLLPRPPAGDHIEYVKPQPSPPTALIMIYRGALWTDLGALYRSKMLRPGMEVELSFDQQARTRFKLP